MAKKTETKEPVKFYDYSKDIDGAIALVRKDGEKLKHKIHNVALSILQAWGKKQIEGAKAAEYYTALGSAAGYHGKALANWVAVTTPLKYGEEKKSWYCPPDAKVNGDNFKQGRDNPFWEVSPPQEAKPFNALALLESLLQKNNTKAANTDKRKPDDKLLDPAIVGAIREAIQKAKQNEEPSH